MARTFWNNLLKRGKPAALKPQSFGITDTGMKRGHNEDGIFFSDQLGLYLVADGMGGHAHGEVASAMAIETISNQLIQIKEGVSASAFKEAIQEANQRIYEHSKEALKQEEGTLIAGMGTTLVGIYYDDNRVTIANVGDSRAYRLRNHQLEVMTEDHSLSAMAAGDYTSPQISNRNRFKNIITRALGLEPVVKVDVREEKILEHDLFLLCSDGLTNMVPDSQIKEILSSEKSTSSACKTLIETANRNGGKDNVSVVLVQF